MLTLHRFGDNLRPVLPEIKETTLPQIATGLTFPIRGLVRNATSASPPAALEVNGRVGDDSDVGKAGVDFLWENCIVVVDRDGNIVGTGSNGTRC